MSFCNLFRAQQFLIIIGNCLLSCDINLILDYKSRLKDLTIIIISTVICQADNFKDTIKLLKTLSIWFGLNCQGFQSSLELVNLTTSSQSN